MTALFVSPFQGLSQTWTRYLGRRSAACAASLCPRLLCFCPYRGDGTTRSDAREQDYYGRPNAAKWRCPAGEAVANEHGIYHARKRLEL